MLGALTALTALALGPLSSPAQQDTYALVQLTARATCADSYPLLEAGATLVAPTLRVYRLPVATARRLAPGLRSRRVLQTIELDRPVAVAAVADDAQPDPLLANEWWRTQIGIDGLTAPGPGKPVTIVDSGLDLQHPEFLNRPDTFALNPQEPTPLGGEHGTSVASLVGAPVNGVGIVGVYPQAVLRSWDTALDTGTRIETSEVVKGITAAAADGPGVINLSIGSIEEDVLIEQAIDQAFAKGSLVVAAAGNDGTNGNPAEYPADYPHVLTVAATNSANQVSRFSSRSSSVDLAAPGENVTVATASNDGWQVESGTSFSAPIVSGAAAWVWTARPDLDNTQLFEVMRRSATDLPPAGWDDISGRGLLNVPAALAYPAPIRDPGEPNDDIGFVVPQGSFSNGGAPLTSRTQPRASLTARLDRIEDPRDVYRVWLPARRVVRVTATSPANVELRVWGPQAVAVGNENDLLGRDARARAGRKQVVLRSGAAGRWAFVDVTIGGNRGVAASYTLSVEPA